MPVGRRPRAIGNRASAVVLMSILAVSCGGGGTPGTATEPPTDTTPTEDPFADPPLEEPKDRPKRSSDLELTATSLAWHDDKGKLADQLEKCLVAPAEKPFTIALENRKVKGMLHFPHNVSIYADPASVELILKGKLVGPGKRTIYEAEALEEALYLFKCDLHPNTMKGVLVVE